jgi:hypothetical protein
MVIYFIEWSPFYWTDNEGWTFQNQPFIIQSLSWTPGSNDYTLCNLYSWENVVKQPTIVDRLND